MGSSVKSGACPDGRKVDNDDIELFIEQDWDSSEKEKIQCYDTSLVTNMKDLFASSDGNADLSSWDVSSVGNMYAMFYATKFNRDVSDWDVSSVTDMGYMFEVASEFNGDVSDWDVSSVADMKAMFYYATKFNGNVSDWDVSSVTAMGSMFHGATDFNQSLCWLMPVGTVEEDVFNGNACSPCNECIKSNKTKSSKAARN